MKYSTVSETATDWGISARRIELLASGGRIEGAVRAGKCWLIPEGAEKPADLRKKAGTVMPSKSDRYVFPFILCIVHSAEQVSQFTVEEKKLYCLYKVYESGDFQKAGKLAEALLSSDNVYIRLGALYLLPTISMYLADFKAAEKYSLLFRTVLQDVDEHPAELNLLLRSFDSELTGVSKIPKDPFVADERSYPQNHLPAVASQNLFIDVIKFHTDGTVPDISSYEIICSMSDSMGYYYCAMLMHLYLSSYYSSVNDSVSGQWHMKKAVSLGLEHDTVFTLASAMAYNPEAASKALDSYDLSVAKRFRQLSDLFADSRNAYADFRGIPTLLSKLKEADFRLISYCASDCSVEEMAEVFGLSRSGMNRRLSMLYKKLGVHSKNEMNRVFLSSLLDWEDGKHGS